MPSKTISRPNSTPPAVIAFYPVVILAFILWVFYRTLLQSFPIWFDETIGKALFFGFPVWLYVVMSRSKAIVDSFAVNKLYSGLFLGLAAGGMFGFATSIVLLVQSGAAVNSVALFSSEIFWGEFFLGIMTGFWETLLFFAFIMTVIMQKYPKWSVVQHALLTAAIFLVFHIPNAITQLGGADPVTLVPYLMVLFLFALGQAFLFYARRNGYALVLSHAIWGMVLLTHVSW